MRQPVTNNLRCSLMLVSKHGFLPAALSPEVCMCRARLSALDSAEQETRFSFEAVHVWLEMVALKSTHHQLILSHFHLRCRPLQVYLEISLSSKHGFWSAVRVFLFKYGFSLAQNHQAIRGNKYKPVPWNTLKLNAQLSQHPNQNKREIRLFVATQPAAWYANDFNDAK